MNFNCDFSFQNNCGILEIIFSNRDVKALHAHNGGFVLSSAFHFLQQFGVKQSQEANANPFVNLNKAHKITLFFFLNLKAEQEKWQKTDTESSFSHHI